MLSRNRTWFSVLILFFSVSLLLAGCRQPDLSDAARFAPQDNGKKIIQVEAKTKAPFKTIVVNGAELLQSRGELGKFGGTFYEASIGDGPKTFNEWESKDATSTTVANMLVSGLITTDAYTGEVVPYLAKEVTVSPDKRTYTVTLRKGLEWSDGKPITSKDVVFTWNEIVKPGLGNPSMRDMNMVEGKFPEVWAVDERTIKFRTAVPFSPFLRNLGMAIAPEHVFKPIIEKGGPEAFSSAYSVDGAANNPEKFVSGGMWLLERYEPRQRVVFKRNPKFFMADAKGRRLPYLDRYIISYVGDQNNLQLQFEQGKVDSYGVSSMFVSRVRQLKHPEFKMYNNGPTTSTTFVSFNLNDRKDENGKPYVDPVKSRWFRNQNFRKAVDYAINREDLVFNILKGAGAPLFTAEGLPSIYLNEEIAKGHQVDLDKARQLLKDGGFKWDQQGRLLDDRGNRVVFNLFTNAGNIEREATGVNVKQDLQKLGIQVNFKPMDFNVLIGKINEGTWETIILGLTGGTLEPNFGANVWRSDGSLHMFNQRKVEPGKPTDISDRLPWEKELDRIFEQGVTVFEFEERKKIYDRYQEIIYEQAPLVYLFSPLQIIAVKDRIQNFDPTPLTLFHNMEEIWIKE